MQEEDELIRSHETLHEQQHQQQAPPNQKPPQQQTQPLAPVLRKISVVSEDSDIFISPDRSYGGVAVPPMSAAEPTIKAPYLSIQTRHETTSTESKDTLTPVEAIIGVPLQAPIITSSGTIGVNAATGIAAAAAVDDDDDDEDASTENIMELELNFETARQKAMRRRSMGRRLSSECCSNYDLNRSQTSLNATLAMSRRQLSLTQSEPDSGNELTGITAQVNTFLFLSFFSK